MGYLLFTGTWLASPRLIWLELLGIALIAWAIYTMQPNRVSVLPDVGRNAQLVTRGPYRWIRHPMYTAVLLIMLALVLDQPTPGRGLAWLILLVDFIFKLLYEESLLSKRFPNYAAYQRRTKRLLPFVWLACLCCNLPAQ